MNQVNWLVFALVSVVMYSTASIFQRIAMKRDESDPIVSATIFQFLLGIGSLAIAIVIGYHIPPITLWPYFLAAGVLYAIGSIYFFKSIKLIGASEMSIVGSAGTIVSLIVSFFFLGERLNVVQWIGTALILAAVTVIMYERKKINVNNGVVYALIGTSCYGLAVVFDGFSLRTYDAISYLPLMSFLPGVMLLVGNLKLVPKIIHEAAHINRSLGFFSLLYVLAADAFYIPIQYGALVSQMSTISRLSVVLTVILAMIFLKERSFIGKKIIGAILATIGIFLIR